MTFSVPEYILRNDSGVREAWLPSFTRRPVLLQIGLSLQLLFLFISIEQREHARLDVSFFKQVFELFDFFRVLAGDVVFLTDVSA